LLVKVRFSNLIFSQNGKADKREVLTYLDPKHPFRSQEEAERLLELSDLNQDGLIDLEEMLSHSLDFLESR
jgi:Ca2+-binding EF-hand superfamily protein